VELAAVQISKVKINKYNYIPSIQLYIQDILVHGINTESGEEA